MVRRPAGAVLSAPHVPLGGARSRIGRVRALACAGAAALALAASSDASLELETLSGERVRVVLDAGDEALVVHFWAVWCVECAAELPALDRAARRCRESPVEVVTVNVGDERRAIERFLGERPALGVPVLRDPRGDVWRRVVGRGLPANRILTRDGGRTELGARDARGWEERLASLGCRPR